jgi:hypothetical protein
MEKHANPLQGPSNLKVLQGGCAKRKFINKSSTWKPESIAKSMEIKAKVPKGRQKGTKREPKGSQKGVELKAKTTQGPFRGTLADKD